MPGLFAAGEVACTRVHVANRLASNSLLEGLVFGARAARAMAAPEAPAALPEAVPASRFSIRPAAPQAEVPQTPGAAAEWVADLMWRHAGLVRDASGLGAAVASLADAGARLERGVQADSTDPDDWRAANLALVGWLIARAALRREESRGGHRRRDFPDRDDLHWEFHVADLPQAESA